MIIKRGSRYGVRVYARGNQVWIGTFHKLSDARAAERSALQSPMSPHGMTVSEFIARWKEHYARPRASTNRHNSYMLKPFEEAFGKRRMADIERHEAKTFATSRSSSVPAVRAMFNDALDEQVVKTNPFANLRLTQSRGRKDLEVISEADLADLADRSLDLFGNYGSTFRSLVLFAAWTAIRPGELFALRWRDLSGDEMVIRHSLSSTGEVTRPKNGRTRRVVLPPQAREALTSMPRRTDADYVFTNASGERLSKTSHYYYWNALRCGAARPGMDFYELRHFAATWLLENGATDSDVAIQLGHTDGGALVRSTYGHPSEDAARDRLRGVYGENGPKLRVVS